MPAPPASKQYSTIRSRRTRFICAILLAGSRLSSPRQSTNPGFGGSEDPKGRGNARAARSGLEGNPTGQIPHVLLFGRLRFVLMERDAVSRAAFAKGKVQALGLIIGGDARPAIERFNDAMEPGGDIAAAIDQAGELGLEAHTIDGSADDLAAVILDQLR